MTDGSEVVVGELMGDSIGASVGRLSAKVGCRVTDVIVGFRVTLDIVGFKVTEDIVGFKVFTNKVVGFSVGLRSTEKVGCSVTMSPISMSPSVGRCVGWIVFSDAEVGLVVLGVGVGFNVLISAQPRESFSSTAAILDSDDSLKFKLFLMEDFDT